MSVCVHCLWVDIQAYCFIKLVRNVINVHPASMTPELIIQSQFTRHMGYWEEWGLVHCYW